MARLALPFRKESLLLVPRQGGESLGAFHALSVHKAQILRQGLLLQLCLGSMDRVLSKLDRLKPGPAWVEREAFGEQVGCCFGWTNERCVALRNPGGIPQVVDELGISVAGTPTPVLLKCSLEVVRIAGSNSIVRQTSFDIAVATASPAASSMPCNHIVLGRLGRYILSPPDGMKVRPLGIFRSKMLTDGSNRVLAPTASANFPILFTETSQR